jgi:hypothetical protein
MKNTESKSTWTILLKVVVAVATALLGILGGAEAYALMW